LAPVRRAAAAIACATLFAGGSHAALPDAGATWSCDFEGTYCGMQEQSKAEPGHRSRFVSTARDGRQAVELNTRPGDDRVHGSGDWERDDLELAASADYCNEGQDEWWAVSVLFPDGYEPTSELGAVVDFHQNSGGGAPPNFNVMATPEGLRLDGFYGDPANPGEYRVELGRIRRGLWYDFVYHVKWTSRDDGFFVAWLNGRKVLAHQGPTLYPGLSCYLKLANYHSPARGPSAIVFDRLIRGTSAEAVALAKLEP
jgi:polysaccharide lyase-like protein